MKIDGIEYTISSGNIYKDLGFLDAKERLAKAKLTMKAEEEELELTSLKQLSEDWDNNLREVYMLIEKTKTYVKSILEKDASGHDWWHIHRVHKLAKHLAEKEGANVLVVELAAILHDISDWKMNGGDDELGPKLAFEWLTENKVTKEIAEHVANIIRTMSFKGAQVKDAMATLEGKIVQDADRLDAIGAIGIARTFAYGGHKGRLMYHPGQKPEMHASFEDYKKNQSHTINHFYEKLLLLKDRMNTNTAKKIAEKRHDIMQKYLADFFSEWDFY